VKEEKKHSELLKSKLKFYSLQQTNKGESELMHGMVYQYPTCFKSPNI